MLKVKSNVALSSASPMMAMGWGCQGIWGVIFGLSFFLQAHRLTLEFVHVSKKVNYIYIYTPLYIYIISYSLQLLYTREFIAIPS